MSKLGSLPASERNILAVTAFGHFTSHLNMLVFPALALPLAQRLGMDLATVLGLSFWQYLLFGLTALPWGLLADRLGARPLLAVFYGGAAASAFGAAFWIDSPLALSLHLAGLGLFSGIYHPAGLGLISKGVSKVSLGMGLNGMAGNLGLASASLLTGLMVWLWGPAAAYVFLGLLNLGGLALLWRLPVGPVEAKAGGDGGYGLGWKPFAVLLGAMMLGGVAYRGATVTLPALMELGSPGLTAALASLWPGQATPNLAANLVVSFIYLLGMLGQFLGGVAGERWQPRLVYVTFHSLAAPAALLMGLATDLPLALLGLVYMFFLLGMQPAENTLVTRLSPPSWRHSAFGLKFVLTFGVGSLAVAGVSLVESRWGLGLVFPCLGVVSLCIVGFAARLAFMIGPRRGGAPADATEA